MNFFHKVNQVVHPNKWRQTTYERLDGTQFQVSIPSNANTESGYPEGIYYNEHDEMEMALKMYEPKEIGKI